MYILWARMLHFVFRFLFLLFRRFVRYLIPVSMLQSPAGHRRVCRRGVAEREPGGGQPADHPGQRRGARARGLAGGGEGAADAGTDEEARAVFYIVSLGFLLEASGHNLLALAELLVWGRSCRLNTG